MRIGPNINPYINMQRNDSPHDQIVFRNKPNAAKPVVLPAQKQVSQAAKPAQKSILQRLFG